MSRPFAVVMLATVIALGCSSPEASRHRGSPGADPGNRTPVMEIHGHTDPGHKTPQLGKAAESKAIMGDGAKRPMGPGPGE